MVQFSNAPVKLIEAFIIALYFVEPSKYPSFLLQIHISDTHFLFLFMQYLSQGISLEFLLKSSMLKCFMGSRKITCAMCKALL